MATVDMTLNTNLKDDANISVLLTPIKLQDFKAVKLTYKQCGELSRPDGTFCTAFCDYNFKLTVIADILASLKEETPLSYTIILTDGTVILAGTCFLDYMQDNDMIEYIKSNFYTCAMNYIKKTVSKLCIKFPNYIRTDIYNYMVTTISNNFYKYNNKDNCIKFFTFSYNYMKYNTRYFFIEYCGVSERMERMVCRYTKNLSLGDCSEIYKSIKEISKNETNHFHTVDNIQQIVNICASPLIRNCSQASNSCNSYINNSKQEELIDGLRVRKNENYDSKQELDRIEFECSKLNTREKTFFSQLVAGISTNSFCKKTLNAAEWYYILYIYYNIIDNKNLCKVYACNKTLIACLKKCGVGVNICIDKDGIEYIDATYFKRFRENTVRNFRNCVYSFLGMQNDKENRANMYKIITSYSDDFDLKLVLYHVKKTLNKYLEKYIADTKFDKIAG